MIEYKFLCKIEIIVLIIKENPREVFWLQLDMPII
jgi:hypothetical protein